MEPSEYFRLVRQIFSEDGLTIGVFRIQSYRDLSVKVESSDSGIKVLFDDSKPKITVEKIITFSVSLNGIYFSENGGVLEINHFPDLPFSYDQILK